MSAPRLLLVDDSPAVLAYESAVLGGHYLTVTAENGREALRLAREFPPAAVLLDLSMPEMDGLEVLSQMRREPRLSRVPVIVISTEHDRAAECLGAGATEFVHKPVRADALRAVVARVLERAHAEAVEGSLGVLCVESGGIRLALPLEDVVAVAQQPATYALETGCDYLREAFDFRGESVGVLDLARRLGRPHAATLVDRKLVIADTVARTRFDRRDSMPSRVRRLALCVDDVYDPEVVAGADVLDTGGAPGDPLGDVVRAHVRTVRQVLPLVVPSALVPAAVLDALGTAIRGGATGPGPSAP
jgi:CheY-like chemotaxis protein/chemotaxis signal transduction protein